MGEVSCKPASSPRGKGKRGRESHCFYKWARASQVLGRNRRRQRNSLTCLARQRERGLLASAGWNGFPRRLCRGASPLAEVWCIRIFLEATNCSTFSTFSRISCWLVGLAWTPLSFSPAVKDTG